MKHPGRSSYAPSVESTACPLDGSLCYLNQTIHRKAFDPRTIMFLPLLHVLAALALAAQATPLEHEPTRTVHSDAVAPPNCFPALGMDIVLSCELHPDARRAGFTMPTAVPSSLTNWWC